MAAKGTTEKALPINRATVVILYLKVLFELTKMLSAKGLFIICLWLKVSKKILDLLVDLR